MPSVSIIAALAIRARTRAQVSAVREKQLMDGRPLSAIRARAAAELLTGRGPKAGSAAA